MANQTPITPGSVTEAYEKTNTPGASKFDDGRVGERKQGCCKPLVAANTFIGVGILLAIIAVVYGAALPKVITTKIEDGVAICEQADVDKEAFTDQYGDCKDCTPYYYALSMFNVTNPMEYLEDGAKLKVQEVGPYVFRRRQIKADVKVSDDGNQVSYKQYTYHSFVQEKSCATCKDTDEVISWDVGYLNVMSQSGGELGFLRRLAAGAPWGLALTEEAREELIQEKKLTLIKWINGLNSNDPATLQLLAPTVGIFLLTGAIAETVVEKMTGFYFNGLFAKRTMSEWGLGYPSLLAGLGLGSNYNKQCKAGANYNEKCASCTGEECYAIAAECKKCASGAKVVQLNDWSCGRIVKKVAAALGDDVAAKVKEATCDLCTGSGVCAAPLPGAAEGSGLDFSVKAPNTSALNLFIQGTGCNDKTKINEFIQYDGLKENPYWVKLDKRRNPTLAELNAFAVYGLCAKKTENMTCSSVFGGDGTSTPPGGASITGFPDAVEIQTSNMYLNNAKQNITLVNTNEVVEYEGVKLTRFSPPNDLLTSTSFNSDKGTGYPVDGVQPLAFNVGFLAYLSYPVYIYGDKSLLEGVEITMADGKVATVDTMYESDGKTLKADYYERYQTTVDIEAGTGKTMRAYKRLMASYALADSSNVNGAAMSDVQYPKLKTNVISPAYIGEESAIITESRLDTYNGIKTILGSLLPVLIAGIIVGVALTGFGFVKRRRAVAASKSAYGENV